MTTTLSAPLSLGRVIAAAMAVQLFVVFATLTPSVLGPAATASLGIRPETLGVFFALQNLGSVLGCLALAGLVRRYGGIRASQLGALIVGLFTALCATGFLPLIAFASFVIGLGMALITPSSAVLLARATPPQRMNLVFSVKQSIVPAAAALSGLVVPWLLVASDWRWTLIVVGASGLAFIAAIQPLRQTADSERDRSAPLIQMNLIEPLRAAFAVPGLRYTALGGFIFNGSQQLFWIYIVSYLHLELGYSIAAAGAIFAVGQMTAVFGRIFWGWVADRLRDPFLVLAGLAAGSSVFFVLVSMLRADWPLWLIIAVSMGFSGTTAAWNGVHIAAIVRYAPHEQLPIMAGAVQVFTFLGAVIAPALFAGIVSLTGRYSSAYLLACALPLVFFAALASTRRRRALGAPAPAARKAGPA